MVMMNENNEPYTIVDLEDDRYYRLNMTDMGRARALALFGAGGMNGGELLKCEARLNEIEQECRINLGDREPTLELLNELQERAVTLGKECFEMVTTDDEEWSKILDVFRFNDSVVDRSYCVLMGEALGSAQAKIESSPVQIDANYDEIWGFAEWLLNVEYGVYVG